MAPHTTHLRRLPPGARFLVRSDNGGIAAHGRVVGPGAGGGVLVVATDASGRPPRPRALEWSGEVRVERDG